MNHISIGTISSSAQIWDPKMYESRKVFWEKWSECMRSVWTVFVTWTVLVYESCKILRVKWSLVTWILFVQLFQGRFLLLSESSLDILLKERKSLTVVDMKFLNVFKCFSLLFSYKSRQYLYSLIFSAVLIYLFFTLLKLQRGSSFGGALHVAVQWEGTVVGQISCCPSLQADLHITYRTRKYMDTVTFIFKNKNNFIFHISLRKCIPLVFWKYLLRVLLW